MIGKVAEAASIDLLPGAKRRQPSADLTAGFRWEHKGG
jgi:hypothetical protein